MTAPYIDISWPVGPQLPTWPGGPGFDASPHMEIAKGDDANATLLTMDAHTGTHVDAPRHFVAAGAELEALGLEPFVGDAWVAEIPAAQAIDADALEGAGVPDGVERLLLRTRNSRDERFRQREFQEDYAALTADGARWVVDRGLALIGVDYLSVQRYHDSPETHRVLLGAGVAILEGLDLRAVGPGMYTLFCLPLRLLGVEAAPARAILAPKETAA